MRERTRKFKKDKRAYYSLIVLTVLLALSLPAELIFNERPLVMTVDGKSYYPIFSNVSIADLGGESDVPITNFQSKELMDFLNGIEPEKIDLSSMFGDEDEDEDEDEGEGGENESVINSGGASESVIEYRKHEFSFIWAPVRYDEASNTYKGAGERVALLSPTEARVDGHYLGTDKEGKDVLARLVYGFRISLCFGLALAVTSTFFGCVIGGFQGFFGGLIDLLGQRLMEIWGSMPRLYLLIIFSSFLASQGQMSNSLHMLVLFGILNLTAWMGMAAYMRAEFLRSRNLEYVKAAKALGVSDFKIMLHHILPNSLTPIITFFPFAVSGGIFALVSLDFLALGVRYPAPSLGELLNQGKDNLHALWILIPTFIVLTVTLTLLTFIGEGVRNAFDPRRR